MATYEFDAPLWRWQARASDVWTFVSLPEAVSDEVLELGEPYARGFGSLRVEATVGGTVWRTSIFPRLGAPRLRAAGEARCARRRGADPRRAGARAAAAARPRAQARPGIGQGGRLPPALS